MQITSFHAPQETSYLENGDRLTRQEFERRYQALPQIKKLKDSAVEDVPAPGVQKGPEVGAGGVPQGGLPEDKSDTK